MKILGVTGKSGSGKSTFSKYLAKLNDFNYISVDEICHKVLSEPAIIEFIQRHISDCVVINGSIDRKLLGDIVFTNRHKYKECSDKIWSFVESALDWRLINSYNSGGAVLDWILLPHTKYWKLCETTYLMIAPEADRIRRVLDRDKIDLEYLKKRDSASIDYSSIATDFVVFNYFQDGYHIQPYNRYYHEGGIHNNDSK